MGNSRSAKPDAEGIKSLLKYAVLAPSSHNTQPWRFRVAGTRVLLYADRSRALPVNDPADRELIISCGCALMNLRVAAAGAGLSAACIRLPEPRDNDLLAIAELGSPSAKAAPREAGLFPFIERRRTYRRRFESRNVPADVPRELMDAAAEEGAWLQFVDPGEARRKMAALIAGGDAIQWSSRSWRRELSVWVRPRRCGDGLTVPGPAAPLARFVIRMFDIGRMAAARDSRLAEQSPILAVLGTDTEGVTGWLSAGQALERLLLTACSKGLQASFLNQPVQVPSLRSKVQAVLGREGVPQIILRLGFPGAKLPASPRRDLDEVITTQAQALTDALANTSGGHP